MKKTLIIAILPLLFSCQKKDQTTKDNPTNIQQKQFSKLPGKYDAKTNTWENPDKNFSNEISFDNYDYGVFSKVDSEGNSLGMGVIDKKGNILAQPNYSQVQIPFVNGFIIVWDTNHKEGLVNEQGIEIVKPQYDDIPLSAEELSVDNSVIRVTKDDKSGYINKKGEIIVPLNYKALVLAGKNRIMFMESPAKWGIMDYSQKIICPAEFNHTNVFVNGKMTLQKFGGENYTVYEDGRIEKQK